MKKLINGINNIGTQLVKCGLHCKGICNDPQNGIIPRCLFLEHQKRKENNGCVVVGINPGRGAKNNEERNFYLQNQLTYKSVIDLWENHGGYSNKYYTYTRDFVNMIGIDGPILWTELVKCENNNESSFPPLQTFRNCTHNYLTKEIDLVPENWPLIAIGREAHKALSYLFPTKSVLGIPHPTSSWGSFNALFVNKNRKKFTDIIQIQIQEFLDNPGTEVWLTQKVE